MRALTGALLATLALAAPAAAQAPAALVVVDPSGESHTLDAAALGALPQREVAVSFASAHGPFHATFAGPLLWDALARAAALPSGGPRGQAGIALLVTGADGYSAVLALGEVSPDLAGKPVLLAERMDGKPLGPGHLHLALPGDAHGARNVRDVVRVTLFTPGR